MTRVTVMSLMLLLLCAASAWAQQFAPPAAGQPGVRSFPQDARRGDFTVVQPPAVLLDGHNAQLAPGARIFDEHNRLLLSGAITGRRYLVNYTRDLYGNVKDVWVLSPQEARLKAPADSAGTGINLVSPDGTRLQ